MNLKAIRDKSIKSALAIGIEVSSALPLLEDVIVIRDKNEILDRCLALFATIACSYGFDKIQAKEWLQKEGLDTSVPISELRFLSGEDKNKFFFQSQVEALNAFAWILGLIDTMDFEQVCDNNLVSLFPDIKNQQSSVAFKAKTNLISIEDIVEKCDLAYCLHWGIKNLKLENEKLPVNICAHVIVERRRAFEWVLSNESWDELGMDT